MRLSPVIGRYRTKGLLGTGTFATVVLAEDEALETPVAIKILAENWSLDPDVRARFVREARILRRIDSPRLIRVHDIGEFEQRPYFVMDFAPGGTLAERLAVLGEAGRLPLRRHEAVTLARELAVCIGAAHSFGLIHRDVKPSNLLMRPTHTSVGARAEAEPQPPLISPDEELVLADFGLARDIAAGSAISVGAGTHGYMAPEQSDPTQAVDERTDVYACTVILASALTGVQSAQIADSCQRAALLEELDPPVADMVARGLATDRERRPSTAGEWLDAFEAVLGSAPRGTASARPSIRARAALPRWLTARRRSPMIGRDLAQEQFRRVWERVRSGERGAILYSGEAGIGKSRLLAELGAEVAAQGVVVLAGRCDESLSLPYRPLADALRPRLRTPELDVDDLLSVVGPHAGHLVLMLPELSTRIEGPGAGSHPESSRALLIDAIDAFLAAVGGGGPLVLIIDDLHAADRSTLGVLRSLLRSDRPEPLLLLGAYRSTEVAADHPLIAAYEDLHRHQLVTRTELTGLDEPALDELVTARAGTRAPPDVVRVLRRQTGGNPFFVEEILTSLAEQDLDLAEEEVERVPDGARDVVRSRVQRLSSGAQRALVTAAVAGDTVERRVIERVADRATLAGLAEAISAGFIERSDDRLVFRHGVVRTALLHDLSDGDAANLHWQVGEALERIHAADIDRHTAEIAHHLRLGAAAGDATKASEYLERAGEQQFRAVALDEAVASLTAALDLSPDDTDGDRLRRMRILELLAETQFWRADPDGMRAAALAAADLARRCGSPEDLARTVVVAARWNRGGELNSNLLVLLDEAASRLPAGDSGLRSQVLAMRAYVLQGAARGFDARTLAEDAEAMARRRDDAEALSMALLVRIYTDVGAPSVARTQLIVSQLEKASARLARDDYRQQYTVFALRARAQLQLAAADRTRFAATRAELGEIVDRMRATFWRSQLLQWDTAVALAEGRFAAAAELAGAALATWDARPDAFRVYLIQMAVAGLERGEHEQVLPEIERVVAGDASSVGYAWRAALAAGLAAQGRTDDARGRLEDLAADKFRGLADDHQRPQALRWLAETIALLRAADAARSLLPIVQPYAGLVLVGPAVTTVEGAADRAIAQLLATCGRYNEAEQHYERALGLETKLGFAALDARTRRWWAQSLHERAGPGDADHARSLADDAATRAQRMGMELLATSARDLAAAVP